MLASAPQLLDRPIGDFINALPWGFFLVVHLSLLAGGAYFAWRCLARGERLFAWGFALFAVAELAYTTYHVNLTLFLFAHTVAEVLNGLAILSLFAAAVQKGIVSWSEGERVGPVQPVEVKVR